MNNNHVLKAVFKSLPPPLSVSISPLSTTIVVGGSVTFTSTVSGGTAPYSYQWYLNEARVSGATLSSWTFTPTASGIYYVYLRVTDANNNTAQSETARVAVSQVPVGGYSISLTKQTSTHNMAAYFMVIALFGAVISLTKRKRK
jgi:PKD repeat protein